CGLAHCFPSPSVEWARLSTGVTMAVAAAFPNFSNSDRPWRSSYTTSTRFASSRLHPAHVQGAACSGTLNISSAERRERAIGGHSVLVDQTEHTIQLLGPVGRPGIGQAP